MTFRIRRAEPSDSAVLTAIAHAAKRHWNYPEAWISLWTDELTVDPAWLATHDAWIVEGEGGVLGWCALSKDGEACSLDHCWVRPDAMGQGVGRMLVQQARASAAALDAAKLSVVSDPNAESFYRQLGFCRTGEHPSRPEGRILPVLEIRLHT